MGTCEHCAGRGWGFRSAFLRRCEVCCRYEDDRAARLAAEPELAHLTLRERPTAYVPADTGAMRCPWCNHLPSNEDIDTFWMVCEITSYQRARVGRRGPESGQDAGNMWLLLSEDYPEFDTCDELRLQCPNRTCGKTFSAPEELDFDDDPEAPVWNGRDWVRRDDLVDE